MELFTKWMFDSGSYFADVVLKKCDDGSGYGIYAKKNFRENEIFISVPREILITARALAEDPFYEQLLTGKELRPFEALIIFFIIEDRKGKESHWFPYIQLLPRKFNTPAMVDPELPVEVLPVTERDLLVSQRLEQKTMYAKVCNALLGSLDYETFLWGWHIVNTRCIFVPGDLHPMFDNSEGDSIAVVPFVDMLNHSNEYQGFCEWNNVMQRYVVTAARSVAEGEQIFVCYGPHTNGRLWIDYGFIIPNNLCDKIPVTLELLFALVTECGIKVTDGHKQAVRDAKLSCTLYSSDDIPSYGFRAALRILQLDYNQLQNWSYYVYNGDEDCEEYNENLVLIIRTLLVHFDNKRKRVPKKYQWLWDEKVSILTHYLENI